jgi:hypothetical protein
VQPHSCLLHREGKGEWEFGAVINLQFLDGKRAYSAESGRRFRANPATRRSPATQGLSDLSSVADFHPLWLNVCASILLSA